MATDLENAQEEYAALRSQYLRTLETGKQYSVSSGNASRQKVNNDLMTLKNLMDQAELRVKMLQGKVKRTKFITIRES